MELRSNIAYLEIDVPAASPQLAYPPSNQERLRSCIAANAERLSGAEIADPVKRALLKRWPQRKWPLRAASEGDGPLMTKKRGHIKIMELFYRAGVVVLLPLAAKDRRMTWHRKLPTTFYLNDGRSIVTLAHARDLLLELPAPHRAGDHWVSAGELLLQGAYRSRRDKIADVHAEISRALSVVRSAA
jgi:hypothetical protein